MSYTVNDFFCGCGGMGLGFKQAGYETLLAWDYDKYAVQSYKHNVDEIAEIKDISQVGPWDVPKADVWTFGFPCQDISVAGKQKGMIKGETRSGLFYAIMDLLEYTYRDDMPKVIMAENVKNVNKLLPIIEKEYAKVGYRMYAQMYSSQYWGIPQKRERYFIVGIRDDLDIEFKHLTESTENVPILLSILDPDVDEKYFLSKEKSEYILTEAKERLKDIGSVHACITPDRINKRQNGRRAKEENEPMFTLTAQDIHGVIIDPKIVKLGNVHPSGNGMNGAVYSAIGLAPTCTTNKGEGHKVVVPQIERVGTLVNINGHDICKRLYDPNGIAPTVNTCGGGNLEIKIIVPDTDDKVVRKLTPNEYGKLQGFPMDDWEQVVSNTQAYKQFGNAVSVPVAKALAEAIIEQVLEVSDGDKQSTAWHGADEQA